MNEGELVPDFELPDQDGATRSLTGLLADGPVVLFFYPAAMTTGCTREACHFRDLAAEYASAGVQRVGISRDPVDKQKLFAQTHHFDYPLLSDFDGEVAVMFGVGRGALARRIGLRVKRASFAIDRDRRLVKAIRSELNMNVHADRALQALATPA